jgi:hypothetical protein
MTATTTPTLENLQTIEELEGKIAPDSGIAALDIVL